MINNLYIISQKKVSLSLFNRHYYDISLKVTVEILHFKCNQINKHLYETSW